LVYKALELEHKKTNKLEMTPLEEMYYNMLPACSLLYRFADKTALDQMIKSPDSSFINVTSLLKEVKSKCSNTELQSIEFYHQHAVNTYLTHLNGWKVLGLENIHTLEINKDIYQNALQFILSFLLETNDAFHLSCAEYLTKTNSEVYFVTLDKDFVTNKFTNIDSSLATYIIRIA
jgi:predicted nucleic acid-binding protein